MTDFDTDDRVVTQHPNPTLPVRERIGYLIYSWDDDTPGDRTRDQYLGLADMLLAEIERG